MTERDLIIAEKGFLDHTKGLLAYMDIRYSKVLDYISSELLPQAQTEREKEICQLIGNRLNVAISDVGQKMHDYVWRLSNEVDDEYWRVLGDYRKK